MHPLDSREGFALSHVKSCLKRQSAPGEYFCSRPLEGIVNRERM